MHYRIKELSGTAFMPQRSHDNLTWHDAVPLHTPTLALAHLYLVSIRAFDAKDTPGVVVWHSDFEIAGTKELVTDPTSLSGFRPMKFTAWEDFEKNVPPDDIKS